MRRICTTRANALARLLPQPAWMRSQARMPPWLRQVQGRATSRRMYFDEVD
jgi:hypothetical protein